MLINSKELRGFAIHATDGLLGTVDELYFDDESWAIRYLTVETGGWLGGRPVLISPISITRADYEGRQLHVRLTMKQVEGSPDIDTHRPISRRHEAMYMGYYGYPYYWGGPSFWGPGFYPAGLSEPAIGSAGANGAGPDASSADSHLRSTTAVKGYAIEVSDGEIGHVDGFLVDSDYWAIRYIEAATRNWWPGKKVLVSPAWVVGISWIESKIVAGLTREAILTAPPYVESLPVTREYEDSLFAHYGRPPYWLHEGVYRSDLDLVGA
jgi:hypothetical protein